MSKPLEEVKKLTIGQLAALVHAIGGLDAVEVVLKDHDLAKRVEALINSAKKGISRSFAELLLACRLEHVDTVGFNENHFPLEPVADDELDWEVHVWRFDSDIGCVATLKRLQKLGFHLCGVRRAMEFIAQNPDAQSKGSIVVTTLATSPDDRRKYLPVFTSDRGLAVFRVEEIDENRSGYLRSRRGWLVLRKKQAA